MITDADVFFRLRIAGEDVTDVVRRFELDESDTLADYATFTLGDDNLVLLDVLHEGLPVEIDLGRPDEHSIVFRGIVTGIVADLLSRHGPSAEVSAGDSLIALSLRPHTKRWWNTPLSGIVREIAATNSLVPGRIEPDEDLVLADTAPEQQIEETDLALLNRLARRFDSKVFIDHTGATDSLNFVSTRKLLEAEPIDEHLIFNANLADFRARFDAYATAGEARLVSTDAKTGETVDLSEQLVLPTEATWSPDPLRIARLGAGAERVAALLLRSAPPRARLTDFWRVPPRVAGAPARSPSDRSLTFGDRARRLGQRARGRASGSIVLRPRVRVHVDGVGGRWSGLWYLARVRHLVDTGRHDYHTAFVCTR